MIHAVTCFSEQASLLRRDTQPFSSSAQLPPFPPSHLLLPSFSPSPRTTFLNLTSPDSSSLSFLRIRPGRRTKGPPRSPLAPGSRRIFSLLLIRGGISYLLFLSDFRFGGVAHWQISQSSRFFSFSFSLSTALRIPPFPPTPRPSRPLVPPFSFDSDTGPPPAPSALFPQPDPPSISLLPAANSDPASPARLSFSSPPVKPPSVSPTIFSFRPQPSCCFPAPPPFICEGTESLLVAAARPPLSVPGRTDQQTTLSRSRFLPQVDLPSHPRRRAPVSQVFQSAEPDDPFFFFSTPCPYSLAPCNTPFYAPPLLSLPSEGGAFFVRIPS